MASSSSFRCRLFGHTWVTMGQRGLVQRNHQHGYTVSQLVARRCDRCGQAELWSPNDSDLLLFYARAELPEHLRVRDA